MSRYGRGVYGTTTYGVRVVDSLATSTLSAQSTRYGEATLTWQSPPGSWTQVRLVRNTSGNPVDVDDGDTLYVDTSSNARTSYVDTQLTTGRYYYYRQFVAPVVPPGTTVLSGPSGYWVGTGSASILTTSFSGSIERLYQRVPEWVRRQDEDANSNGGYKTVTDYQTSFLYRFLSLFGFNLDLLRTDTDHLLDAYDALTVSENLLPTLAGSLGVGYETAIGSRAVRRLTANATRIWKLKGTISGIRELANVVTGYGAHVRIGTNLALDNAQAGPVNGVGNWTTNTYGASVTYRANKVTDSTPSGNGVRSINTSSFLPVLLILNPGSNTYYDGYSPSYTSDSMHRAQYAIPVNPTLSYAASSYFRTASAGVTVTPHIQWLDVSGNPTDAPFNGPSVPVTNTWSSRSVLSSVAYPGVYVNTYNDYYGSGARYAEVTYTINGMTPGVEVLQSGFQVEESTTVSRIRPAREILIYLDSKSVNWVTNTNGAVGSGADWSPNVVSYADPNFGQYLTIQNLGIGNQNLVELADAEIVDSGFVVDPFVPPFVSPFSSLATVPLPEPTKAFDLQPMEYLGLSPKVFAGEYWSVSAEVIDPDLTIGTRTAQIGIRYYDGPNLISTDFSLVYNIPAGQWTPISFQTIIPPNAPFDRIRLTVLIGGGGALSPGIRKVSMQNKPSATSFFFDGATPSATGDFLWEGTPFASRSHYYPRRSPKISRLSKMLDDFIPNTGTYRFIYAYPSVTDSPRASSGSDIDLNYSPFQVAGINARSRWSDLVLAGSASNERWAVLGLPVGVNANVRWYTKPNYPTPVTQVGINANVLFSDLVYYQVGVSAAMLWNNLELIEANSDIEIIDDPNTN